MHEKTQTHAATSDDTTRIGKTRDMFTHMNEDAPEGTLAHTGYRLYLADLRLKVALIKTFRIRELTDWISKRLG